MHKITQKGTRRELKFKLGDQVRINKSRPTFKKGYLPSWTEELFTVFKIIPRVPPVYRLRDYADNETEGGFYAEELQKVVMGLRFGSTEAHTYPPPPPPPLLAHSRRDFCHTFLQTFVQ